MFLHNLKYELLTALRTKDMLLWIILFPLILATLFQIAFGSIYEQNTKFSVIPAAVVSGPDNENFRLAAERVSDSGEPLLRITDTDEETALGLLKNGEVYGIFNTDTPVTLTVSGKGIHQSILKTFAERYNATAAVLRETAASDPQRIPAVLEAISAEVTACTELPVTEGNPDPYIQFFHNLIAMVALFGTTTGLHICTQNQANLSALGARKCCSPTRRSVSIAASLTASYLAHTVCMVICVSFQAFVLGVDFGSKLPLVYLAAVLAGCMGVTMGFFVGSIGRVSTDTKTGIVTAVTMTLCFLSGLMIGNIKAVIAAKAPWFNRINPAAIISDCFYCLNLYSDYARFREKICMMLLYTLLFAVLGICMTRRRKYASI